jgi:porphobilinogen deaminase
MPQKLTIATRESRLALWQANFVKAELERQNRR